MADYVDINEVSELDGYVEHVSSRSQALSKSIQELEGRLARIESDFGSLRKKAAQDVGALKDDVAFLKESVVDIQKLLTAMIGQMKNTLKKADFDRFEKRLDAWAPENLVNRKEMQRILSKVRP